MATMFEPIASVTLASDAADVTISSIPATYTDLVVVLHVQDSRTTNGNNIAVQFNSDTGTNYSYTQLYGNGTSALSTRGSNLARIPVSGSAGPTAGGPAIWRMSVQSYADTSVYKTALIEARTEVLVARAVGLWRDTSAITSMTFYPDSASYDWKSGSTFSLYGIKAA